MIFYGTPVSRRKKRVTDVSTEEKLNYTLPFIFTKELKHEITLLTKDTRSFFNLLPALEVASSEKRKIKRWNLKKLEQFAPEALEGTLSLITERFMQESEGSLLSKIGLGNAAEWQAIYFKTYLLTTFPPSLESVIKRAVDEPSLHRLEKKHKGANDSLKAFVKSHFFFPSIGITYLEKYHHEANQQWLQGITDSLKGRVSNFEREHQQVKQRLSDLHHQLREKRKTPVEKRTQSIEGETRLTNKRIEEEQKLKQKIREAEQQLEEINDAQRKYKEVARKLEAVKQQELPFSLVQAFSQLKNIDSFENPLLQHYRAKAVLIGHFGKTGLSQTIRTIVEKQTGMNISHVKKLLQEVGRTVSLQARAPESQTVKIEVANKYSLKPWLVFGNVSIAKLEKQKKTLGDVIPKKKTELSKLQKKDEVRHFLEVQEDFWTQVGPYEKTSSLAEKKEKIAEQRASSTFPYQLEETPLYPKTFNTQFRKAYVTYIQGNPNRTPSKDELKAALYKIWSLKGEIERLKEELATLKQLLAPPNHRSKQREAQRPQQQTTPKKSMVAKPHKSNNTPPLAKYL